MSEKAEADRFVRSLREVTRSLTKKRFWTLVRESIAEEGAQSGKRQALMRAAAAEVARLAEPSARIELNGHSASSLLRAIAEAGNVDPPAFAGVKGKGPDETLIQISPFDPSDALFVFAWKRKNEDPTFVHGYFNFSARDLMEWLGSRHGRQSVSFQRMSSFISHAAAATIEASVPDLTEAILARLRL